MAYPGARIVVLCCFLLHLSIVNLLAIFGWLAVVDVKLCISFAQGIAYLFYPLVGLLADIWFTRYKIIKISVILQLVTSALGIIAAGVWAIQCTFFQESFQTYGSAFYMVNILILVLLIAIIVSTGMFEANAIQFGMDQMMEASSDQITTFIHWYYWSMSLSAGLLLVIALPAVALIIAGNCMMQMANATEIELAMAVLVLAVSTLQFTMTALSLCLLHCCKRQLTIEPAGHNPFITVYMVLKYAWKHNCPQNRSAFTYWEEDIPPRIDLGKNKYGGPFTTEEVEDTKTFFSILLLLVSLFGFHLSGNGFTVSTQLMHKMCPSSWVLILVTVSPSLSMVLIAILIIPVLNYLLIPYFYKYIPNMLTRLGLGLMFSLVQEMAGVLVAWEAWYVNNDCHQGYTQPELCFWSKVRTNVNGTCQYLEWTEYCGQGDDLFLWLLIPIFFNGISYLLVFMTALEFICAQAPLRMKGLLIGLWYATFAIRCFLADGLGQFIIEDIPWFIFHGVRCFLILLSLVLYCCVAKYYRYRQRDEVVNEQYLVEEVYDRELRLAEEYEREKREEMRALFGSRQSIPSYRATDNDSDDSEGSSL